MRVSVKKLTKKYQKFYAQKAYDAYGSAIRDNEWLWKVEVGRWIELDGHDPYDNDCQCPHCEGQGFFKRSEK